MKILFVMDPLEQVQIDADTTFALMLAAQERGHSLFTCHASELWIGESSVPHAFAKACTVRREEGNHATIETQNDVPLADFDAIFMRSDPPFDVAYLHATHLLQFAENAGVTVVNKPSGLRGANEKLYALNFPEFIPKTIVTSSHDRIKAFIEANSGVAVVKPVDGHGGDGVFVVRHLDKNKNAILEVSTKGGKERVICQQFLPDASAGDKRILMLNGEPLGAILRVPKADENRGNIHVGGTVEQTTLTEREKEMCNVIGPRLREDGLWFVGLDVIGDVLTEVNVTSPTGIQEMSRLDERDYAGETIQWLESTRSD